MLPGLVSSLEEAGVVLLSVSQAFPVFQLPLIAWAMLAAAGALGSRRSFNTSERPSFHLSKTSFQ